MDHRRSPRFNAVTMEISISDRVGFSTGTIKDISRYGVCITDLPRRLQTVNNSVVAIITAKGNCFKLHLNPQWEKQEGLSVTTGAAIAGVPWDWIAMIMQQEYQTNDILAIKSPVTSENRL